MRTTQITAVGMVGLTLSLAPVVVAQSFGILGMPRDSTRIETREEASKLPVGTTLTFKCARCGGMRSMVVDERKTELAWFHPFKAKRCAGPCDGWVNYVSRRTAAGPDYPDTFNTCSRCRRPTISWTVTKAKEM
jgi:transcription elongation factor Elf1